MVAPNTGPLEQRGPRQRQDAVAAGGDARDQQIADLTAALRARDDFIARGRPILLRVSAAEGVARLQVSDQGEGIPDAARALIFEPFTRVVTDGRQHGGFVVGLWVVRQLTLAMQGQVTVASTPGDGSTFTVTLPCAARQTTVAE